MRFKATAPAWSISALGLLILFAAFTGHCNACGYGFERDYLGDMIDER